MNSLEKILGINFPKNININGVTNNSHNVKDGFVFFALDGLHAHGSKYISHAIELGASMVIHNDLEYLSNKENIIYVEDLCIFDSHTQKNKVFLFLEEFYQLVDIQSKNNYFAFTGTNGKTSTAYLTHQMLVKSGYESIYIGTLGTKYNNEEINKSISSKTTPDIFEFFKIFSFYNFNDSVSVCIEISSHALSQERLKGISFYNSAALLNIGTDHLDYHGSLKEYTDIKFQIFNPSSPLMLINEDLAPHKDKYEYLKNSKHQLTTISKKNKSADIYYEIVSIDKEQSLFNIIINNPPIGYFPSYNQKYKFSCNLFPEFNIENLVFGICSIGFADFSQIKINDLNYLTLPKGRTELINNIPANVIIDFAHNAEGIELFLLSIKNYFKKIVVVFGCGGDRDKLKRPKMMKAAIGNASKIIFTSDNSRSESFNSIFNDALKGNDHEKVISIEDRREAIIQGSKLIGKDDCLVILGKGHEVTQEVSGKKVFFSDHGVINEIYK